MVAIDIYLNETTRHADVILPPTSALERDQYDLVFHCLRGPQHGAGSRPRSSPSPTTRSTTGRSSASSPSGCQARLGAGLKDRLATKARFAPSPATIITGLLKTGGRTTMRALRKHPEGVDLGPLRPDHARAAPDRRPSGSTSRPSWSSPTSSSVAEALDGTPCRRTGRAAADRPPAPAGLQLLAAQHRAADPRQAAAPPAHAPQGPRRARPRGRRGRPGHLAGRQPSTSR